MEEFIDVVSKVGFPIAVCLWFMFRTEKVIVNNTKALNTNSTILTQMLRKL
ncbi:MAG: YvrJ family protein [Tenericutes bacterium]|nr:MAG: YvrJ family protein [Mycoplasmatota bacterium]